MKTLSQLLFSLKKRKEQRLMISPYVIEVVQALPESDGSVVDGITIPIYHSSWGSLTYRFEALYSYIIMIKFKSQSDRLYLSSSSIEHDGKKSTGGLHNTDLLKQNNEHTKKKISN